MPGFVTPPVGNSMATRSIGQTRIPAAVQVCILAACAIALLSFGVRTSFGLFLEPLLAARGWERETFGLALALQNLVWGAAQPMAGALGDSRGHARILIGGAILYALGTALMAVVESPVAFLFCGGVVAGLGLAGASWTISVAAAVRIAPPHLQSWATGLAVAACSLGQLTMATLGQALIAAYGWQTALWILAGGVVAIIPCALVLPNGPGTGAVAPRGGLGETLRVAMGSGSFWLIFAGFCICGFHAGFVFTHLPAYVVSINLSPQAGALALAAVGLANLFSSYAAGVLGQSTSRRGLLVVIYACRAVALLGLARFAAGDGLLLALAVALGVFWMSSIPPTSGLLGQIFGPYYTGTLLGAVFFGHQVGAFLGAWLGGVIFDRTGSYAPMWWICVGLSIAAALLNIPVDQGARVPGKRKAA